jgi:glyceraldehyde 3-phosphate dehydrogenase
VRKIRIGINGFGRIGRAFARINLKYGIYDIVLINDIDPDINNIAYLLKYDSTYGKLQNDKISVEDQYILVNKERIKFTSHANVADVDWNNHGVDVIIDSSGVLQNVLMAKELVKSSVKKVLVTHSPKENIDFTFMYGVNDHLYKKSKHHVVSTSICDANAVAPFFRLIDESFGIELAEVTTLHPWLSYQNLLDGGIKSISSPGHYWSDYALGRSSIGGLIPKQTTLVSALEKVLPDLSSSVHAMSFRTPTAIVAAADGVFLLKKETTIEDIKNIISKYEIAFPGVLQLDGRSLISTDYLANENAAIIDERWLSLNGGKMLKFVLWYDNEWGYTKRVYDSIKHIL